MPEEDTLTPEDKKILSEVYAYSDKANYSDEELEMARKMFDTPEKFALLRKILQVHTPEERGITFHSPQSLVNAEVTDLHKYAIETAVNHLADEKVRQTLLSFYRIMRGIFVDDKRKELEAEKQESFEEGKRTEEYTEQKEIEERVVGERL